jgi:hypothetical protein
MEDVDYHMYRTGVTMGNFVGNVNRVLKLFAKLK